TRDYLLRGLIRCECGRSYVGSWGKDKRWYRCGAAVGRGQQGVLCRSKMLQADWLEQAVWKAVADLIRDPEQTLVDARAALRSQLGKAAGFDAKRRATLDALVSKETERERVISLYRKGLIDADEAERELEAVSREAGRLREDLEAMRAQT